jgi:serine/threonine protein kinase
VIGDRYEAIEQIGTGGMATVWRARDTLLGRQVAIKRLLPHLASDPVAAARFSREAQAAARLSHPGIVTVFDSGEDVEGPFIVLELIEGLTLADHLAGTGPLEPATAIDIVSQVASALDHAHSQGVIHRDIKPANVILDHDGRARLADFGIARTVEDPTTITASGDLVGTIAYLAPETLAGEPATPASDVYSLGAVSYELLAGSPPYAAESPAALLEAVRSTPPPSLEGVASDRLASAVSAAMSKDPAARPRTAGELATAMIGSATLVLGPIAAARGVTTPASADDPTVVTILPPVEVPSEAPPPMGRGRWAVFTAVVGILALAAIAMSADRDPTGNDEPEPLLAAATSTTATTTVSTTTTTLASTTTTTPATTTTPPRTPETVAVEIEDLLAALQPSRFKPKEVRQVKDRLHEAMGEWADDNREDLARALEDAFDELDDLESSSERDTLNDRFIELAELMGFQVEQGDGDGGGD